MTTINNRGGIDMTTVNKIYADDTIDLPATSSGGGGGEEESWLSGYTYRKAITISGSNITGDVSNFPVLVRIASDNDLRTTANSGHVENGSGYDIAFADAYGNTYYYDRLVYAAATGQWYGYVSVPTLSSGTTNTFYLYYGNSGISTDPSSSYAWDEYYMAVWHLHDTVSTAMHAITDSSRYRNDGTVHNQNSACSPTRTTGKIYYCYDFSTASTRDCIDIPDNIIYRCDECISIEMWISADGTDANMRALALNNDINTNVDAAVFADMAGTPNMQFRVDGTTIYTSGSITASSWYHICASYDGTNRYLYVNGSDTTEGTGGATANANYSGIGWGHADTSYTLDGRLEEVRVSRCCRCPAWFEMSYNNQNSPATWYNIGSETTE